MQELLSWVLVKRQYKVLTCFEQKCFKKIDLGALGQRSLGRTEVMSRTS